MNIYFECCYMPQMFRAVLAAIDAKWELNEKAGVLTLDEGTARCVDFILEGGAAYDLIAEQYNIGKYPWTKVNLQSILAYIREFAKEIGEDNEIDVIFHFNWNNANRYTPRDFEPLYSASQVARALFVEDDPLNIELFETLAEYALEEFCHSLDSCQLSAKEAALKLATANQKGE